MIIIFLVRVVSDYYYYLILSVYTSGHLISVNQICQIIGVKVYFEQKFLFWWSIYSQWWWILYTLLLNPFYQTFVFTCTFLLFILIWKYWWTFIPRHSKSSISYMSGLLMVWIVEGFFWKGNERFDILYER